MDGFEKKDGMNEDAVNGSKFREEIFSKVVRAGKRTYFFDVKATRKNDYYLTITESKKRFEDDGKFYYEKHKIFLYKEDFEKFTDGLAEIIDYICTSQPAEEEDSSEKSEDMVLSGELKDEDSEAKIVDYTQVDFDDLNS